MGWMAGGSALAVNFNDADFSSVAGFSGLDFARD
jgi:hypothetical protein